jgi:thiol-disulfide isomerase/thioredoxin
MLAPLFLALSLPLAQAPAPGSAAQAAARTAIAQAAEPVDCVKAVQTFVSKRQQEVRPASGFTSELLKQVDEEKVALAKSCVARFAAAAIEPSHLAGLAELYLTAGQPDEGRSAMARSLAAQMPSADRAATLTTAINVILSEPKGDERNARLEKLIDELDASPGATFDQKFGAHSRLLGYYRGDDIDAGIIKHATWMAGAAKAFTPDQRKAFGTRFVSSQVSMAEALAGQAMNDEALALLRSTQADWSDVPRANESYLAPAIARYSLVGTAAARVKAPRWLNAPSDMTEMAMDGAVTLLEFTAHWCGPCRESYPGINRLRQQYGPKGFRVVMVTRYWGYYSQDGKVERSLAPEEELKRDIGYFQGHHLDVPVAVGDQVVGASDYNDSNYKVGGIPQIHLIDKQGRIRLIMVGYDEANEPKLAAMIAKLVAEPGQAPGVINVPLQYRAPGDGPKPNFGPKGTPVPLTTVAADASLPVGAGRPAKAGTLQIGPDKKAWMPVLVAADAKHPQDLCNLFLDRNRNGNFEDDGPAIIAAPSQNEKTKAWWTSFNKIELSIPYPANERPEPYLVNFWIVRDGDNPPDVIRYSVGSWRYGTATIGGAKALVAAMDADNDAVFGKGDYWSVLEASAADAEKNVLSHTEARSTSRLMFVKDGDREQVLEFRSFSPDGRRVDFAIVDRPVTRAADRAGDDVVRDERPRPRTAAPFSWGHDFAAALVQAKASGKKVFVDFEATWCGPCKTMDEWIWTDAEVASQLNAGFVGVKLDGDIEKALVKRFAVKGYPTMLVLDAAGAEANRGVGYLSSKDVLALLNPKR